MKPMSASPSTIQISRRLRDQAIAALVPFITDAAIGDRIAARTVAQDILDDYRPGTPKELQLAAEIIAFGFAALACLSAAMVAKHASFDEMLRFQGDAIALDRASQKATRSLEARRREWTRHPEKMTQEAAAWDEGSFQSAINQALEKMTEANARLAIFAATEVPPEPRLDLPLLSAEPMTKAVLARRKRR
jgi:hypothetical protein